MDREGTTRGCERAKELMEDDDKNLVVQSADRKRDKSSRQTRVKEELPVGAL